MAKCAYCGTRVFFGGVQNEGLTFCNQECEAEGFVVAVSHQVPSDLVAERVREVHAGTCPRCGGRGPVDVHMTYRVWSAGYITQWSSRPHVACRGCGIRAGLGDTAFSFFLGWWGFPWGFIMTPVQLVRNVVGMIRGPGGESPTPALENLVRLELAAGAVDAAAEREAARAGQPAARLA